MEQLDAKLMIRDIYARKVLDCEGNFTIETEMLVQDGGVGRVSVPSGAAYLCGNEPETGWAEKAVESVNAHIAQEIIGRNVFDQEEIDKALLSLYGAENINAAGMGAVFSVSAAAAVTAAAALKLPLYRYLGGVQAKSIPVPAVSMFERSITGKCIAGIRDIVIIPESGPSFSGQLDICTKIHRALRKKVFGREKRISDEDRSGYIPAYCLRGFLRLLQTAAEEAGLHMGKNFTVGLAVSASQLYDPEKKCYRFSDEGREEKQERCMTADEIVSYYEELTGEFPITHLTDPLDGNDWDGWMKLTGKLGDRVQIAGDALFQTDVKRLEKGIQLGAANAVVARTGQKTLTEMAEVIRKAQESGYSAAVSGHAGETADSLLCDLSIAFRAGMIYAGPLCHMEYAEKYNRLLRIEEKIGEIS